MTREIIPIVLAKDFNDFKTKLGIINALKPKPKMIQIDISDGQFTPYKNFNNPSKLARLKFLPGKNLGGFEMHLMVNDPIKHAKAWIKAGAKRILFHAEPFLASSLRGVERRSNLLDKWNCHALASLWARNDTIEKIINYIHGQNLEVGLCLSPETPIKILWPYIKKIDCVLILCVTPGRSGQKFQTKNLAKIRALRKKYPSLPIEVDGGVNLDNAKKIFQAGATRLTVASAILNADNPQKAYTAFIDIARSVIASPERARQSHF